jgi:dTDP-4-amino-4,6-dideoxygalactose transaminase
MNGSSRRDAGGETPRLIPLTDLGAMTADVSEELDLAWKDILTTSSFIGGGAVERFEEEWAAYCGARHAVGVANGTDAIELTLRALGIGEGDEVLVPANTFVATAEAVVLAGAIPRFVDVDPQTLLVTPDTLAAGVTDRTSAVIVVHLYGSMPHMGDVSRFAQTRHLALLEDAAQAHGSTWMGAKAGSFGVAGCFSFYPGKNLGAFGDAGAIVTDDGTLAGRLRSLANHGRALPSNHVHSVVGRNSRLDAVQAAVLSAKLTMLDRWNVARRDAMAAYHRRLRSGLARPVEHSTGSTYHQNVVRVPGRDRIQSELARRGVQTGIHYPIPCHRQAPYRRFASGLHAAEDAAEEILSLPLFPHITQRQIDEVCDRLEELLEDEPGEG